MAFVCQTETFFRQHFAPVVHVPETFCVPWTPIFMIFMLRGSYSPVSLVAFLRIPTQRRRGRGQGRVRRWVCLRAHVYNLFETMMFTGESVGAPAATTPPAAPLPAPAPQLPRRRRTGKHCTPRPGTAATGLEPLLPPSVLLPRAVWPPCCRTGACLPAAYPVRACSGNGQRGHQDWAARAPLWSACGDARTEPPSCTGPFCSSLGRLCHITVPESALSFSYLSLLPCCRRTSSIEYPLRSRVQSWCAFRTPKQAAGAWVWRGTAPGLPRHCLAA